jgi:hypothetical protein
LTDRQLDGLRRHCFRNGNHVLFNYAVGVCHGQGLNLARMREITGFDCGYTLDDGEVAVRVKPGTHELLAGIEREIVYGTYGDLSPQEIKHHAALNDYPERFDISPRFYIRGGGEILGETINYGPRQSKAPSEPVPASTGMPTPADETWSQDPARRRLGSAGHAPSGWQAGVSGGLAVVDRAQWVSVLSVAPLLPREILRNIAAAAGCHVYTDFPGQVFHCHGYFGMYFHASGTCHIRLPHAARVTDVIAETLVSHRTQELCLNAQANTTVLYKLEPGT